MQEQPSRNASSAAARRRTCPACGGDIPTNPGYTDWCDRCNWNLEPERAKPKTIYESINLKLGEAMSRKLLDEMLATGAIEPRLTISDIAACALAGIVHGITLIFLLAGILLLVDGWPNIVRIVLGLLSIGIAIAARPRFAAAPTGIVPRESHPSLYALADAIADMLGTARLDGILVSTEFNASLVRTGWRGRRYMVLGIPMFALLTPQERVALIGHEIGHGAARDRGLNVFVGSAIDSLAVWYRLIRPASLYSNGWRMGGLIMIPVNLILYGISEIIRGMLFLLSRLHYRSSQRAEYLADHLGARISGRDGAISGLDKVLLHPIYAHTVERFVAGRREAAELFGEVERRIAAMPEREVERIRRVSRVALSRLDASHPPTPYRLQLLEEKAPKDGMLALNDEEARRIEREIAAWYPWAAKRVLEQQHARLHGMRW